MQAHVTLQKHFGCRWCLCRHTLTPGAASNGYSLVNTSVCSVYLAMPDHVQQNSDLVRGRAQLEHLDMTEVQAALYADALNSLRSAARSSGLQPGAPVAPKQRNACALRACLQACSAHAWNGVLLVLNQTATET